MKRKDVKIDTSLIEKYSEKEILVLCGARGSAKWPFGGDMVNFNCPPNAPGENINFNCVCPRQDVITTDSPE